MRALAPSLVAIVLAAGASSAPAAVTLGQLSPAPGGTFCIDVDAVPITVTSGNAYRIPGNGTITSWSTNGRADPDQVMAMKIFSRVADPDVFRVVGRDGPRPLSATGGLQTFAANVPVKAGELLGVSAGTGGPACAFMAESSDSIRFGPPISDGSTGNLSTVGPGLRLNISAVFVPSNVVTFGATTRNKKKGTATIEVTVPNTGELTATGPGVNVTGAAAAQSAIAVAVPGTVKLTVRAKGKKRKKLNRKGKVKSRVAITYTPTGGDARTESVPVKLRKKLKKKR